MSGAAKREWRDLMSGLGVLVGKAFLKKAVFTHRSEGLAKGFEEALKGGTPAVERAAENSGNMAVGTNQTSIQIRLDTVLLLSTLTTLKEDIFMQGNIDAALRIGVVGPCQDPNLPACENERVDMARFVVFVASRLGLLKQCYTRLREVLVEIEDVTRGLIGEGKVG